MLYRPQLNTTQLAALHDGQWVDSSLVAGAALDVTFDMYPQGKPEAPSILKHAHLTEPQAFAFRSSARTLGASAASKA